MSKDSRKGGGLFADLRSLIDRSVRESAAVFKEKGAGIASVAARVMTSMGRDAGAKSIYMKVLQEHPDDTAALFGMAGILLDRGSGEVGLDFFERAIFAGGKPEESLLLSAVRHAIDAGEFEKPARWIDLYTSSGIEISVEVSRISAKLMGLAGKPDRRRVILATLVSKGQASGEETVETLKMTVEAGIVENLTDLALRAVKAAPGFKGQIVSCLESAVGTLGREVMLALAEIWAAENDFRRAAEWRLELAGISGEDERRNHLRKALGFYSEMGATVKETEILFALNTMDPADAADALALAERLEKSGDAPGAISVLEKCRVNRSYPGGNFLVFKRLVLGLFRTGRYAECLEVLNDPSGTEEALDQSDRERFRLVRGRCLFLLGRHFEAREALAYVLSNRSPGDPEVAALAEVLVATGEILGLAELLDKAQSEKAKELINAAAIRLFGSPEFPVSKSDASAAAKLFRALGIRFSLRADAVSAAGWYASAARLSGAPEDRMALARALGSAGDTSGAASVFYNLFADFKRGMIDGWGYDDFAPYLEVLDRMGACSPPVDEPASEGSVELPGVEKFLTGAEYTYLGMLLGRQKEALAVSDAWFRLAVKARRANPHAVSEEIFSRLGAVLAVCLIREARGAEARERLEGIPFVWEDRWLVLKTLYSREGAGAFLGSRWRVNPASVPDSQNRAEYCYLTGRCLEEAMDFRKAAEAFADCERAANSFRDAAVRATSCKSRIPSE